MMHLEQISIHFTMFSRNLRYVVLKKRTHECFVSILLSCVKIVSLYFVVMAARPNSDKDFYFIILSRRSLRHCEGCGIINLGLSLKPKALQSPQPVCTPPTILCNTTTAAAAIIAWPDLPRTHTLVRAHTQTQVMIPTFTNRLSHTRPCQKYK